LSDIFTQAYIALLEDIRHGSREAVAAAVHQHNRKTDPLTRVFVRLAPTGDHVP
jgi:hypothetical protein